MATGGGRASGVTRRIGTEKGDEDSSESDGETEPAKSFHRRLSTNKEIKYAAATESTCEAAPIDARRDEELRSSFQGAGEESASCHRDTLSPRSQPIPRPTKAATKEGFLMKQTWSFNRWRRRYFQLKGHKLYYAKDPKAAIFDEIDLTDLSFAEGSIKNANHSFQVITPFRRLVLCAASRRDMEEWIGALKAAAARDFYEAGDPQGELLSGRHRWYAASHARPTYCNVCREALSGVMSHGLSCEVCKFKVHKRCAARAQSSCKWTTLASVGKDILEDVDGNISMPHQWLEGNLPVSAKCAACDRTCGSVLRLQDWRCLWCHAAVHNGCRPGYPVHCPLGPSRVSVVPPIALHNIGSDEAWEAVRPQGCSPLLVFVNSKSGDNQGVKFLRRFKQLLNPAQVFDLVSGGPGLGLRLFRHFDPFRILVCSGDGSVGWVLSEIDRLNMHRQCQLGVLPLGTGNDLARVLGWGASCDDDTHLPQLLERYEKAGVVMLDRWSVMAFERRPTSSPAGPPHAPVPPSAAAAAGPGPSGGPGALDASAAAAAAAGAAPACPASIAAYEDSVVHHLTQILQSDQHSAVISSAKVLCETIKDFTVRAAEVSLGQGDGEFGKRCQQLKDKLDLLLATLGDEEAQESQSSDVELPALLDGEEKGTSERPEKEQQKKLPWSQREALVSRANSLKKAVRRLVEHTEQAVDEQNAQPPRRHRLTPKDTLKVLAPIESGPSSSCEPSPCPSPGLSAARLTAISPLPEVRRDSAPCPDDLLLLPAPPDEFADRRRSEVDIMVTTPSDDEEEVSLKKDEKELGNLMLQDPLVSSNLPAPQRSASDTLLSVEVHAEDVGGDVARRLSLECLEDICHIDSPESTEPTSDDRTSPVTAAAAAAGAGLPILSSPDEYEAYQEDAPSFGDDEDDYSDTSPQLVKGCSLAQFEEGNDIARRSFYHKIRPPRRRQSPRRDTVPSISIEEPKAPIRRDTNLLDVVQIHIQGSSNNLQEPQSHRPSLAPSEGEEEVERELLRYKRRSSPPVISVDPPSPTHSEQGSGGGGGMSGQLSAASPLIFRRFSDDPTDKLSADTSLLSCSPAATRRISSGSLFKTSSDTPAVLPSKRLPIINPLVRLPMWPNVQSGIVSKVLLANADALCAAVSPLMDPDESLLQGYLERCVMNNYFGIGIDAKISLDFHQKREEHPEKCRSRAKNYMWYGVLGSREWLQKTYKNLEQRVQLECDGQRIPLPSLQGIVVLNIPSFMGGTNFWGGSKEDEIFLAPSFDDRILEVVAVFGSMQMAASRLINLQHHRIAQCQTVQISILGDEGVPVQVDGEAWVQPPGVIRIIHKNRMQMLCRNRALETSLRAWEEKRRHRQQLSPSPSQQASASASTADPEPETDPVLWSQQENLLLLGFIESATTVVKYVKLTAISQPLVGPELYQLASHTAGLLERLHPGGKIVEGPNLRPQVTELVQSCRQLYEEACALLRDKQPNLRLREDLEHKLGGALASLETELRRCVTYDSAGLVHFQPSPQADEQERKGRGRKLFRLRFRRGGSGGVGIGGARGSRELVQGWGTAEVAEWLEALQLGEYAEAFTRHDVHGKELLALGRRDLRELGVTKVGHVKRILAAVRELAA